MNQCMSIPVFNQLVESGRAKTWDGTFHLSGHSWQEEEAINLDHGPLEYSSDSYYTVTFIPNKKDIPMDITFDLILDNEGSGGRIVADTGSAGLAWPISEHSTIAHVLRKQVDLEYVSEAYRQLDKKYGVQKTVAMLRQEQPMTYKEVQNQMTLVGEKKDKKFINKRLLKTLAEAPEAAPTIWPLRFIQLFAKDLLEHKFGEK